LELYEKVKVTPKEDGVVISVEGYEITVSVKPKERVVPKVTVESVKSKLTKHLEMLELIDEAEGIVVKLRGFLDRDRFASIAAIVEEMGGRYISAGKESRFFIPK
jgi:hypothetical protein